jgi:hypothetical protein
MRRTPRTLGLRHAACVALIGSLSSISSSVRAQAFRYGGGPVVSHVEVVVVFWGNGVSSIATANMENFYKAIVDSPFMDWLGEYDSAGQPGANTNQHIGHGTASAVKAVTISPAVTLGIVTDGQIQAELQKQVTAGVLPKPTADPVEGHVNTLYAIYFPPGLTIRDAAGGLSCQAYCAYHGAVTIAGAPSPAGYSIIPDMTGMCHRADGTMCHSAVPLERFAAVSSHELAEVVTDIDNKGWTGPGGEIGDVCRPAPIAPINGFMVQPCWSNRHNACIASDPNLPLCDGMKRPCRSCVGPNDCLAAGSVCDNVPSSRTAGQCVGDTNVDASSPVDGGPMSEGASGTGDDGGASDGSGVARVDASGSHPAGGSGSSSSQSSSSGSAAGTSGSGSPSGVEPDSGAAVAGGNSGAAALPNAASANGCACSTIGARPRGGLNQLGCLLFGGLAVVLRLTARRRRPFTGILLAAAHIDDRSPA